MKRRSLFIFGALALLACLLVCLSIVARRDIDHVYSGTQWWRERELTATLSSLRLHRGQRPFDQWFCLVYRVERDGVVQGERLYWSLIPFRGTHNGTD